MAEHLTVGDLRSIMAELPDDTPIIVKGGAYDYTDAATAAVITLQWMDDPEGETDVQPYDRTCLSIEHDQ